MRFVVLILLATTLSCAKKGSIDKSTAALVPVENIQVLFERFTTIDSLNFIAEKRGNTLLISNVAEAENYVQQNEQAILLDPNLRFTWDTLSNTKKLFVLDKTKIFPLKATKVRSVTTNNDNTAQEMVLTDQIKKNLSVFFAHCIGKEIIAVDKNGFIGGASELGKSENGNILIQNHK